MFYTCTYGLFPLSDSDSDSDTDSCTMQDFSIGSDSDSDPLIEMYVIQYPFGKGIGIQVSQWKHVLHNTM